MALIDITLRVVGVVEWLFYDLFERCRVVFVDIFIECCGVSNCCFDFLLRDVEWC